VSGFVPASRPVTGESRVSREASQSDLPLEDNMSATKSEVDGALRTAVSTRERAATPGGHSVDVEAYTREIVNLARGVRLADVFRRRSDAALYWQEDRYGITTVAMRTTSLSERQLLDILLFRLAQYLQAGQLDPRLIFDARLSHEPTGNVSKEDVHFLSGVSETGEILAYGTFKALPDAANNKRICEAGRSLFPVEEVFGRGLFNRLRLLADLPAHRVREAGRLMKNHSTDVCADLMVRAPIELLLGAFQFASAVTHEFEACVGDVETGVAKKAQDFFHLPTILLRGTVPFCEEASFGFFNYQHRTRHPYAFRCADISAQRLAAVDAALSQAGKDGVEALMALRADACAPCSSFEPAGGLPPLNTMDIAQVGVPMSKRREMLRLGEWLRRTEPLRGLSVAEAAALGTLVHRTTFEAGEWLLRRGSAPSGVMFIERGSALLSRTRRGQPESGALELAPFDYFGETSVLCGSASTDDVVAATKGSALVVDRDVCLSMLFALPDVRAEFSRKALERCNSARLEALATEMPQ
jgi:Cyclic nucleotide-binding domain